MTFRPAPSKRLMIWPMTFLATASGLMIERVRSIAICIFSTVNKIRQNPALYCADVAARGPIHDWQRLSTRVSLGKGAAPRRSVTAINQRRQAKGSATTAATAAAATATAAAIAPATGFAEIGVRADVAHRGLQWIRLLGAALGL